MENKEALRQVFQTTLQNLRNSPNTCAMLEKLGTALGEVQQVLAQENIRFDFSFAPYDAISPVLDVKLQAQSGKHLTRSVTRQCAVTYHINNQDYPLALASFSDDHYRTEVEYLTYSHYERRVHDKHETYDAAVSAGQIFRFDSENPDNPLTSLKTYIVEQAAKQKFLQSYDSKSQPRRIKRAEKSGGQP